VKLVHVAHEITLLGPGRVCKRRHTVWKKGLIACRTPCAWRPCSSFGELRVRFAPRGVPQTAGDDPALSGHHASRMAILALNLRARQTLMRLPLVTIERDGGLLAGEIPFRGVLLDQVGQVPGV
jgi:hypothetical protein